MIRSSLKVVVVALLAISMLMLYGCTPGVRQCMQMCQLHHILDVYAYADGLTNQFSIGLKFRELLKPEFETWQKAGYAGFATSDVTYMPDVCLVFGFVNSAPNEWPFTDIVESCDINFTEKVTVLNAIRRGSRSQYIRSATAADKSLRKFLLDSIANGKLSESERPCTWEELGDLSDPKMVESRYSARVRNTCLRLGKRFPISARCEWLIPWIL